MLAAPNCCSNPDLETIKNIYRPPGPIRDLMQCSNCHAYWFLDIEERMNFSGGEDRDYQSYKPVEKESAVQILKNQK